MIVLRELFVTMLRSMVESSGGDFSAKWVGKWKTGLQCVDIPLGFLILIYGSGASCTLRLAFLLCFYVVVFLTLYSGWIYIRAALNMNKSFYLPPRFALIATAHNPGTAMRIAGIDTQLDAFAEGIRKTLL